MSRKLEVVEQALSDLAAAFLWYEQQRENLGMEFLEEWENTATYIVEHPENCQKKYKEFRQAILKRFPYLVTYEIEGDSVVVYSVKNAKQHPLKHYKKLH